MANTLLSKNAELATEEQGLPDAVEYAIEVDKD